MTAGTVLLTGGDGQLGRMLLKHSGDRFPLRLTYLEYPIEAPGHEVIQLDVTKYEDTLRAMQGVKAVVHFAANSAGADRGHPCCPTISNSEIKHVKNLEGKILGR